MIRNIRDLATLVECEPSQIGRRLYKSTDCGICYNETDTGVAVQGYAEGSDGECESIKLVYPFTADAFWEAVGDADTEGCEAWHEANDCYYCGQAGCDHSCDESQAGGF